MFHVVDTVSRITYIYWFTPNWNVLSSDALATTLSALYGKLLVVMGTAFPMAEVISTYIPPSFYDAYYIYLYVGSMVFLLYMYTMLLNDKRIRKRDEESQMRELITRILFSCTLPPQNNDDS